LIRDIRESRRRIHVVHVEPVGRLFEVNLHLPKARARTWFDTLWIRHFLTNEEVLFNPDARLVSRVQIEAVQTLGCLAAWSNVG
jgi:hypothetical protein